MRVPNIHENWLLILLVIFASSINFMAINRYPLPPGSDPGSWLFLAHNYLKGIWFSHPPFFFIILGFFGTFLNELIVLKIMGALSFSLIAVPTFFIVKHLINSRKFAFLASILTLFSQAYAEMLGWGAYPNGLAIAFMYSSFYFVLLYQRKSERKSLAFILLFSILTALTHHLSAVVLIATGFVYAFVALFFGDIRKNLLLSFLVTIPSLLTLLLIAFLANQVHAITYFNEAAFYLRRVNLSYIIYVYRSPISLILILLGSLGILATKKQKEPFALLLSWALTPILLTQLYLIKFPVDYVRFLFYSVQPLIIGAVYLFFLILQKKIGGKIKFKPKHFSQFFVLICVALFVVAEVSVGVLRLYIAADYYQRDRKEDFYTVLIWIKENTPENAIIATSERYDNWIKGVSRRDIISAHNPMWLFEEETFQKAKAAYLLLFGTYEIDNGYVRARGLEPIKSTYNPLIGVKWEGEYQDVLFIQDELSDFKLDDERTIPFNSSLLNITSTWLERSSEKATYQTSYILDDVVITKEVSIKNETPEIEVTYTSENPKVTAINVTAHKWYDFKIQDIFVGNEQLIMNDGKTVVNIKSQNTTIKYELPYFYITSNSTTLKISFQLEPKTISTPRIETLDYREIIKEYDVSYIVCSHELDAHTISRLEAEEELFQLIFRNPSSVIFRVIQDNLET